MDLPLVSTIITSYNKGPYLGEAIESALRQDYQPQQVLVVDDGSTDNTREVVESFGSRVEYVWQRNGGQSSATNHGIRLAKGELVAFLDGDDRWRPEKLSKQVAVFREKPDVSVVYTAFWRFDDKSGQEARLKDDSHIFVAGNTLDRLLIFNFIPFSSAVVRRDCLLEVGMLDESIPFPNDLDLWLRIALRHSFEYIDEELLEYRTGTEQVTSTIGDVFLRAMAVQRAFVQRFFGGRYPRPHVVRRATAVKYAAQGDLLLARGRNLRALRAHACALTWEPLEPARYFALLRDLVPNKCVGGWMALRKRLLGSRRCEDA